MNRNLFNALLAIAVFVAGGWALRGVLAEPSAPAHAPAPAVAAPEHETFTIESYAVHETRRINVYLPPDYAAGGEERYPVMYMPDGGIEEDFPHVAATIDAGIRAGEMRSLILVGIENTQRRRDMTPPTTVATDRRVAPVVGHSADFRAFIADELMPEIDRRYRTDGESAIIGESLAGLFVVEIFLLRPELFDTCIAISPSLWWNADDLVVRAPELLAQRNGAAGRLYLTSADETDIAPQVLRLAGAIEAAAPAGLEWLCEPRPDLQHHNIYRSVAPGVLRRLYAADG